MKSSVSRVVCLLLSTCCCCDPPQPNEADSSVRLFVSPSTITFLPSSDGTGRVPPQTVIVSAMSQNRPVPGLVVWVGLRESGCSSAFAVNSRVRLQTANQDAGLVQGYCEETPATDGLQLRCTLSASGTARFQLRSEAFSQEAPAGILSVSLAATSGAAECNSAQVFAVVPPPPNSRIAADTPSPVIATTVAAETRFMSCNGVPTPCSQSSSRRSTLQVRIEDANGGSVSTLPGSLSARIRVSPFAGTSLASPTSSALDGGIGCSPLVGAEALSSLPITLCFDGRQARRTIRVELGILSLDPQSSASFVPFAATPSETTFDVRGQPAQMRFRSIPPTDGGSNNTRRFAVSLHDCTGALIPPDPDLIVVNNGEVLQRGVSADEVMFEVRTADPIAVLSHAQTSERCEFRY